MTETLVITVDVFWATVGYVSGWLDALILRWLYRRWKARRVVKPAGPV